MDVNLSRLRYIDDIFGGRIKTIMSNKLNIEEFSQTADLLIGAVLLPGAKSPKLISREMIKEMMPGSVVVDVGIDQGGILETSRPTTHSDPIFVVDDVVHYCVANMPGAVARTSTYALTNATLPYVIQLANRGWKQACIDNEQLKRGLNVVNGEIVYPAIAQAFGMAFADVDRYLYEHR